MPMLIDNRDECLATIRDSSICIAKLPRIKVSTRKLLEATNRDIGGLEMITEMTKTELDVDGYQKSVDAHVIPRLSYELIFEKP